MESFYKTDLPSHGEWCHRNIDTVRFDFFIDYSKLQKFSICLMMWYQQSQNYLDNISERGVVLYLMWNGEGIRATPAKNQNAWIWLVYFSGQ